MSKTEIYKNNIFICLPQQAASTIFVLIMLSHLITFMPGSMQNEYGAWGIIILLFIYALIAVPAFVFFYLMFFIAHRVSKASMAEKEDK